MANIRLSDPDIGQRGYEQYAECTGRKTFDGQLMPVWNELPQNIRDAWCAAAHAIVQFHRQRPLRSGPDLFEQLFNEHKEDNG